MANAARWREWRASEPKAQRLAPYLVFLAVVAMTISLWLYAARTAANRDEERFQALCTRARAAIENRVRDHITLARVSAALLSREPRVDEDTINTIATSVMTREGYRDLLGLGYSEVAIENGRRTVRVKYAAPKSVTRRGLIGYDMYAEPTRRATIDRALAERDSSISAPVVLFVDQDNPRPGFLIFSPVYEMTDPARVRAFFYTPVRANAFFDSIQSSVLGRQLRVELRDAAGGKDALLYASGDGGPSRFRDRETLAVLNRQWTLELSSTPEFESELSGRYVALVPFLGFVIAALLFALSLAQRRAREEAEISAAALERELVARNEAERAIRQLNEELESLVRERTAELARTNQELEAFVYSVSHDLRTPLRTIDGFGHALQQDYGTQLDLEANDAIARIRRAAKRMDGLISALLGLSRISRAQLRPERVDLAAIAREAMAELAAHRDPTAPAPVLRIAGPMTATADPQLMRIVFDNLLANALKFQRAGNVPEIELLRRDDGGIEVRDNGIGFEPEYAAKLFQPFERLHPEREFPGTGIGLATVARIITRHGGRIEAEGRPNVGATFRFWLDAD
ncbi:MAG: CHASE domain-containing protein [Fimbriimonadaceae bacterium]|nr:CHASE domain-containing protein [Fimbriimonadaceae bacterium]